MRKPPASSITLGALIAAATLSGLWSVKNRPENQSGHETQSSGQDVSTALQNSSDPSASSQPRAEIPSSLIEFTETFLGLTFLTTPAALLGDHELILDAASQKWTEIEFEYFVKIHYAMEAIGLVPENCNLGHQLITAETIGARGAYDHTAKQIVLGHDFDFGSIPDQAEVIKLLSVALVHQHQPNLTPSSLQEFLALRSVEMGAASLATERFYAVSLRHFESSARHRLTEQQQRTFDNFSSLAKQLTLFPLRAGHLYLKTQSTDETSGLFAAALPRPKSINTILGTERPQHSFSTLSGKIELEDQLTPAITEIALEGYLSKEGRQELLEQFRADRISLATIEATTETGESADTEFVQTIWETQWLSTEAAQTFYETQQKRLAKAAHTEVSQTETSVRIQVNTVPVEEIDAIEEISPKEVLDEIEEIKG